MINVGTLSQLWHQQLCASLLVSLGACLMWYEEESSIVQAIFT